MQTLSWITHAKRPLTTRELQHALAVEVGESEFNEENLSEIDDIVSVCAGLVTVDEESNIIRLVHYTTQEYFERTHRNWFKNAEADIATVCAAYLSFSAFESGPCHNITEFTERLELYQLYDYAAQNWGHHARKTVTTNQIIMGFLESQTHVEASSQALFFAEQLKFKSWNYGYLYPTRITGMHTAAYFGVGNSVGLLLKNNRPDAKDSDGRTPLISAAMRGHEAVVQLLLEKGANIELKDRSDSTPLALAVSKGSVAAVQLLLEMGANTESNNAGLTPLARAAFCGHEDVVRLLLEKGANIESKNRHGRTPLSQAAWLSHTTAVQLLLEKGADIESKDEDGKTPLNLAAGSYSNDIEAMRLFIERVANIESKDRHGRTPLSKAAWLGHTTAVQLLLEKGADIESKDENGKTPLNLTVENDEPLWVTWISIKDTVRLLLEKGANTESKDRNDQTPLSKAARRGHTDIVHLLLEKGADVESKDDDGKTPLNLATEAGRGDVVQLLRQKGATSCPAEAHSSLVSVAKFAMLSRGISSGYRRYS